MTVDSEYMFLNYVAQCKRTRLNRSAHSGICLTCQAAYMYLATEAWGWHQAGTTDCMTGQTTCLAGLTRLSRTCTYMSRHRTCTYVSSTATP